MTEVSLPERLDPLDAKDAESRDTASESKAQSNSGGSEDGDWIPIIDEAGGPILPVTLPQESDGYLSEYIANVSLTRLSINTRAHLLSFV